MAYTHDKIEVMMTSTGGSPNVSFTATGKVASWVCGIVPHILRAVSVIPLTTNAPAIAGVASIRTMATAGTTSTTGDQVDNITLTTTAILGKPYYVNGLDTEIEPGGELEINITTAATGRSANRVIAYLEPRWEVPGNLTQMVESA